MKEEDFYTGEPTNLPPPDNMQNEYEAANMASFGKYDYDPASRVMNQQMMYPGAYGFNNNMNPPVVGLGTPYRYSQYGNIQPTYGIYQGYQQPQFNGWQQPPQPQVPRVVHIPGISNNGEYLAPIDIQDQIANLQLEYLQKFQENEAKNSIERRNSVYGYNSYGGYNYYGVPYYNPYQYNSLNAEINQRVEEIKQNARQARLDFDMSISRLAHNVARDQMPDEVIRERYEGRDIELPAFYQNTENYNYQLMAQLDRMQPFDNSQFYRDQFARVSAEFNSIISKDADMQETFSNMGLVAAKWDLEEEAHRRRDCSTMYQSGDNGYKYFVRKKAEERYAKENGIALPNNPSIQGFDPMLAKQQALQQFSVLNQSVKLSDDGTLNVTCNVGSHAGQVYSVNDKEAGYDERRDRFRAAITESIYGNKYA